MFGFNKPKVTILGSEFAGVVDAVGQAVTQFKPGDAVFGYRGPKMGANAEYLCVPEDSLIAPMPDHLSFAEAAAIPYGALTALNILRKADIQPGQKVLINGASGSIGSFALQLAKHYGAEVTGVDSSGKLEMLRSIGADHVIDYTSEDYTKNGQKYDVIMDTIGGSPFAGSVRSLNENGTYLNVNPKMIHRLQMGWSKGKSNKKLLSWEAGYTTENLLRLKELIETGAIKPVVDRIYPMEQIAEAHRYVETDQKKGNVVISMVSDPSSFQPPALAK
jgi:NADPH:quinone reductase-like Zn-dependent oxidoreductase